MRQSLFSFTVKSTMEHIAPFSFQCGEGVQALPKVEVIYQCQLYY